MEEYEASKRASPHDNPGCLGSSAVVPSSRTVESRFSSQPESSSVQRFSRREKSFKTTERLRRHSGVLVYGWEV